MTDSEKSLVASLPERLQGVCHEFYGTHLGIKSSGVMGWCVPEGLVRR
jgi:hypothetical protein